MLFNFENSTDNCLEFINRYFELWCLSNDEKFSIIKKVCMFKHHIVQLKWISPNDLVKILTYLDKVSRTYYLSKKYTKKWLGHFINKKQPINTSDLELSSLDITNFSNYINYIDYKNRQHYLFTVKDFTGLIYTNLENCYMYDIVPQPLDIKNPYTNNIFTREELIDIHLKYSSRTEIPLIWNMFINCGYSINLFREEHYDYLLKLCIPSFVDKLEDVDILYYLYDIFNYLFFTTYCKECIREKKYFRDKKIRNVLIYWIRSIKLNQQIDLVKINIVLKLYSANCEIHKEEHIPKKKRELNKSVLIKNIDLVNSSDESIIKYVDFSNPFIFSIGTYTEEDRRRYKDKLREKKRFKKRLISKNIL
jgi:hypothetical protein